MKHLTVRDVPDELAEALRREKERRGGSLNRLVIELLGQSLGVAGRQRSNGLAALAGTWSESDHREFEAAIRECEQIDEELWE